MTAQSDVGASLDAWQQRVTDYAKNQGADDAMLDWLDAYAKRGGHLVLGSRTGYADHEARARAERAPARLTTAAGVCYDEFSNLTEDVRITAWPGDPATGPSVPPAAPSVPAAGPSAPDGGMSHTHRRLDIPPAAAGTRWVDGLTVDGADILAEYDHPHFGRWPAITTTAYGQGRVTTVGTVPNRALAEALVAWLAPEPRHGWQDVPATVTVHTGSSPDGRKLHFVHNWSWDRTSVVAPADLSDALSGDHLAAGDALTLGSWDVRVLAGSRAHAPRLRE